jgi:hypothetical protein
MQQVSTQAYCYSVANSISESSLYSLVARWRVEQKALNIIFAGQLRLGETHQAIMQYLPTAFPNLVKPR